MKRSPQVYHCVLVLNTLDGNTSGVVISTVTT